MRANHSWISSLPAASQQTQLTNSLSIVTHHQPDLDRVGCAEFEILFTDRIYTETNSFKKLYLT